MLTEVTHLQDILQALCAHTVDPNTLPPAGEQILKDIRGTGQQTWAYQVLDGVIKADCW